MANLPNTTKKRKGLMPGSERYIYMAEVLKAMAHPTRLFILDKLTERDYCVGELKELIGVDISTVSRHLMVLKQAGIIGSQKSNNQVDRKSVV